MHRAQSGFLEKGGFVQKPFGGRVVAGRGGQFRRLDERRDFTRLRHGLSVLSEAPRCADTSFIGHCSTTIEHSTENASASARRSVVSWKFRAQSAGPKTDKSRLIQLGRVRCLR